MPICSGYMSGCGVWFRLKIGTLHVLPLKGRIVTLIRLIRHPFFVIALAADVLPRKVNVRPVAAWAAAATILGFALNARTRIEMEACMKSNSLLRPLKKTWMDSRCDRAFE